MTKETLNKLIKAMEKVSDAYNAFIELQDEDLSISEFLAIGEILKTHTVMCEAVHKVIELEEIK